MAKRRPRSYWNYRVMTFDGALGPYLEVREVHYEGDRPVAYTLEAARVWGDDPEEMAVCLDRMREAMGKPFLTMADFRTTPEA